MKKFLSVVAILLSVLVVLSSASFGGVSAAIEKGDANKDGSFNEIDVLWMRKMLIKEIAKNTYADVNENGAIDSDDVRQTRRMLVEVQKEFVPKPTDGDATTTQITTTTVPAWEAPYHNTTDAPFYDGGVPRNYYNKLASAACDSAYIADGINRGFCTVAVNQAGYTVGESKIIKLVEGRDTTSYSFIQYQTVYLVEETTKTVKATYKSGIKRPFTEQLYGTDYIWYSNVDISAFDEPGTYRIYAPSGYSLPFTISENPYARANDEMIMGLYYQRCGGEIDANVLKKYDAYLHDTYGDEEGAYYSKYQYYAHEACHLVSKANNIGQEVVVVDQYDSATGKFVGNTDSEGNLLRYPATDFAYGLHDAGDYGRYTQPAAQVVADLVAAYELTPEAFALDVVQDKNGEGNADTIPDILDHARWEAKFILNMQNNNKSSSSYGGFYFKICTETFASAQGAYPANDRSFNGTFGDYGGLRVMNVNFASTAACAGALASCAYTFKDIDPVFAQECLEAAQRGYDFYNKNRNSTPLNMTSAEKNARDLAPATNQHSEWKVGGGAYGGSSSDADNSQFYMYAALYRATGDAAIHSKIKARLASSVPLSFACQTHGGYGTLAYILTGKKADQTVDETYYTKCVNAIYTNADSNIKTTGSTAFGNLNNSYGWGSNARWANELKTNTIAYYLGSTETDYNDALRTNLSYMLGVNPEGWCFVSGLTEGSSKNIHHYPSALIKKAYQTVTTPGLVAGGYTKESSTGSGWSTDASKFRYRDDQGDHVSNEICVYWNSSITFAYATVFQEDALNAAK